MFKVRLDTQEDIVNFVNLTSKLKGNIILTDRHQYKVDAKSLMGVLYASKEFTELWCDSDTPIEGKLIDFLIVE